MVFVRDGFEVDADWIIREQKAGDLLEHGVVSPLRFLSVLLSLANLSGNARLRRAGRKDNWDEKHQNSQHR
jgi:hypothetical protein